MDENVPHELDKIFRERGINVSRFPSGTPDDSAALAAKRERRIIISFDKDFSNPFLFPPDKFHGIIRLKIHPPIIEDVVDALDNLFKRYSPGDLNKKLVILERDGFRIQ